MNWGAFWLSLGLTVGLAGFVGGMAFLAIWLEDHIGAWSYAIPFFVVSLLAAVGFGLVAP